jgi:hypothetical protein
MRNTKIKSLPLKAEEDISCGGYFCCGFHALVWTQAEVSNVMI